MTNHVRKRLTCSHSVFGYRVICLYFQASEVSDKMLELLIVMDSMDIEEEEEVVEADNTDKDSGLDSSDENYMDIEIFA